MSQIDAASTPTGMIEQAKKPTVTQSLKAEIAKLQERAAELQEAVDVLERHPETQEVLDALGKIGRIDTY